MTDERYNEIGTRYANGVYKQHCGEPLTDEEMDFFEPTHAFINFIDEADKDTVYSAQPFILAMECQDEDVREWCIDQWRVRLVEDFRTSKSKMEKWEEELEEWRAEWNFSPDCLLEHTRRARLFSSPLRVIDNVQTKTPDYLIAPYLPRGMITILAGQAGIGKTTVAMWLACGVSNGQLMPGKRPGTVFYLTHENDAGVVLRPRMEAMGGAMERILIPRDTGTPLTMGDPRLWDIAKTVGCKPDLVIFDPVQSFMAAGKDMNSAADVRTVMDELNRFAGHFNTAVLLIAHLNKYSNNGSNDPCERIMGSNDFRAVARSICFLGRSPEDPNLCVLAQAKNSLGALGPNASFVFDSEKGLRWVEQDTDLTAQQVIQFTDVKPLKKQSAIERAKEIIKKMLAEQESVRSNDVMAACAREGISYGTVYRAKNELKVEEERHRNYSVWRKAPDAETVADEE